MTAVLPETGVIDALDFAHNEPGCEIDWYANGDLCGVTPVTHRVLGCQCVPLACTGHALSLVAYWARNAGKLAFCHRCGQRSIPVEQCRVVPL